MDGSHTGSTGLLFTQLIENGSGRLRRFGQHDLQKLAQDGFDWNHIVRFHSDMIRQRTQQGFRLLQSRHGALAEAFVRGFQLLEHAELAAAIGLLTHKFVQLSARTLKRLLKLLESRLALLHRFSLMVGSLLFGLN